MEEIHPLTKWRATKGLTQHEAGAELGVTRWTINSIEVGRRNPSLELAKQISAATGIPKEALRPDVWERA